MEIENRAGEHLRLLIASDAGNGQMSSAPELERVNELGMDHSNSKASIQFERERLRIIDSSLGHERALAKFDGKLHGSWG